MAVPSRLKGVSLIFACGTALFADGYANSVIGSVNTLLTRVYGSDQLATHNYSRILSSLAFAGTIVGMLTFGYLSDKVGRKFGMMLAAGIVVLFSGLSAASSGAHGSIGGTLSMLSACRFLLGIGVGAEYPCGTVAASEQSEGEIINRSAQHRWVSLATNTMIDFGFVLGAFMPLLLFWIFGPDHLRAVWRGSLLMGVFPALAVLIWRFKMEEPVLYQKNSMKYARIPYMLVIRRYWVSLAAISTTWFIYDFIVYELLLIATCFAKSSPYTYKYPFGIYSTTVVNNVTGGNDSLSVVFGWGVVINLFYMPGTIGGAFIVDYLGPKYTMITGLLLQAITGFIMSALYVPLSNHIAAFAVVYGVFLSFGELGPGNSTLILAGKTSSTAVRGQFFGIAAATGKVGAFVGTWAFPPMIAAFGGTDSVRGNTGPFWVGSGLAILSALITFFFVKPLTHDGMVAEDQAFREYLEENGYDTSAMGLIAEVDSESASGKDSVGKKAVDNFSSEKDVAKVIQ